MAFSLCLKKAATNQLCLLLPLFSLLSMTLQTVGAAALGTTGSNLVSNITLLDLYPELKEYLLRKAIAQLASSTAISSNIIPRTEFPPPNIYQEHILNNYGKYETPKPVYNNGWGTDDVDYINPYTPHHKNKVYKDGWGSKDQEWNTDPHNSHDVDPHAESSYGYEEQLLKDWYPFGTPAFWDSWKYKPSHHHNHHPPPVPSTTTTPGWGWDKHFPFWEEEEETHHHHEETKDVSCLAALFGLKALKTLKIAKVLGKLKLFGMFLAAFKLGVLLSPAAIPLLFPLIILLALIKAIPLIVIIILLLKILKKKLKLKKPFGKLLDQTGSFIFEEEVDEMTERVLNSEECVDKISCGVGKQRSSDSDSLSSGRRKIKKKKRQKKRLLA